ncbi:MAG: HigA family addiction module antidote protein [Bacteroidales bacterium]|nr:HigA family addiction module antidote protein [Bacteroidales bacterium]
MEVRDENKIPWKATHPGEILLPELEERGLSQRALARMIGMNPSQLNELIKGKRPMTESVAIKLEQALGIDASVWMNLQLMYVRHSEAIKKRDSHPTKNQQVMTFTLRMPQKMRGEVQARADALGTSINHFINMAISNELSHGATQR